MAGRVKQLGFVSMNGLLHRTSYLGPLSIAYVVMKHRAGTLIWQAFFSIAYAAMNVAHLGPFWSVAFSIAYAAMNGYIRQVLQALFFSIAYAAMNSLRGILR